MTNRSLNASDIKKIKQDERTVMAMARIYCRGHQHICEPGKLLCVDCKQTIEYANERTRRCPQKRKGTCDTCTIQCYKPAMREKIRAIMAYSGPRMMFHHPLMALQHLNRKKKRGQREYR